jgi:microcystin-dependent protein
MKGAKVFVAMALVRSCEAAFFAPRANPIDAGQGPWAGSVRPRRPPPQCWTPGLRAPMNNIGTTGRALGGAVMETAFARFRRLLIGRISSGGPRVSSPANVESLDTEPVPPPSPPTAPLAPEAPVAAAPAPATLAMAELFVMFGPFPQRSGQGGTSFNLGMVHVFAGSAAAYGAPRADGRLIPIKGHQPAFSVLGSTYGGDGMTDFALPDLRGRVAIGGRPDGEIGEQSLILTYMIAPMGGGGAPLPGMVALFAPYFVPDGWLRADGALLPKSEYGGLFYAIGTTFGGNETEYSLPDLQGAAVVGAGQGPGLPPVALGQKVSGPVPGIGLNYLICTRGYVPPNEGLGEFPDAQPFLGQVIAYAGANVPPDWAACDGALVRIEDNRALYAVIGTTYGGDGTTNFALPDLRGRMVTGLVA